MNNDSNSGNFKTAIFADCLANSKEIFQLIDRVFPLDSCRHYEVLPLKLNGSNLVLGMLNPDREDSLKFVRSIARVFKYDLSIRLIDSQTHQIILANYPQNQAQSDTQQDRNQTVVDTSFNPTPLQNIDRDRNADSAPTIASNPDRNADFAPTIVSDRKLNSIEDSDFESSDSETKLLDLPADFDFLKDLELTPKAKQPPAKPKLDSTTTVFEIPPEFINQKPKTNLDHKTTIVAGNPADLLAESIVETETELETEIVFDEVESQISQLIDETFERRSQEAVESESTDFLTLSELSCANLLETAFEHQSDYLKLIRYSDRGTIIASKNKINQFTLNSVPLPIFCSLLDEIKRMARLPQNTSSHSKKVVLERFHEEERVLLRMEFTAQQDLQEVRIQILRDRALKSYEQQRMDRTSDRALELARQLEKTLRRIQACLSSAELTNLTELQTVHSKITHQLRLLDKQR